MINPSSFFKIFLFLFIWAGLWGTALADQQDDPWEAYNRSAFILNQNLDKHVLVPIVITYRYIWPQPVRTGVTNFFYNLSEVPTVINDILQANFLQAYVDTWRFAINSSLGIGGIFDVAKAMGLQPHDTDFGLTLAKWGWRNSNYFVLPVLGPSTFRDGTGLIINYFSFSVYQYINPFALRAGLLGFNLINIRSNIMDFASLMEAVSFDPYVFQRNAYMQHRQFLIQQTLEEKPFSIPNDTPAWKKDSRGHTFR